MRRYERSVGMSKYYEVRVVGGGRVRMLGKEDVCDS